MEAESASPGNTTPRPPTSTSGHNTWVPTPDQRVPSDELPGATSRALFSSAISNPAAPAAFARRPPLSPPPPVHLHPFDRRVAGLSLPQGKGPDDSNSWCPCDPSGFNVRQLGYSATKQKAPSQGQILHVVGMDQFRTKRRLNHVAQQLRMPQVPGPVCAVLLAPVKGIGAGGRVRSGSGAEWSDLLGSAQRQGCGQRGGMYLNG